MLHDRLFGCRYEDDKDEGEWFLYTGSGGRDLSGNKRTSKVGLQRCCKQLCCHLKFCACTALFCNRLELVLEKAAFAVQQTLACRG